MFKNKLILFFIVILLFLIASLNWLAFSFYWYWRIWWFDLLMHFLGGVVVAALSYFFYLLLINKRLSFFRLLTLTVASALIVGGLWEVFEFSIDAYWSAHVNIKSLQILQAGWWDTLLDLLFDFLGGITCGLVIYFLPFLAINNLEKNKEEYGN